MASMIKHDADGVIIDELEEGTVVAQADMALVQALNKSEIDIQITTAKSYPRSIRRFINSTTEMVTLSPEVAKECMYTLPRGRKAITGASVRFAEIVKSSWGNNRCGARVVSEEARVIRAQGLFHDLETNSAITIEVTRRITDSEGRRYNDDMIAVTGNAATSIALRNAILKGIPKALWFPLYQKSIATAAGDEKTMPQRRGLMFEAFKKLGAEKAQLLAWLELPGEEDIGVEHFMTLGGLLNTFKDGVVNVKEFFETVKNDGAPSDRPVKGGDKKRAAKAAAPAAAKKDGEEKTDDKKAPAADASKETPPAAGETKAADGETAKPVERSDALLSFIDQVEEATTPITTVRLQNEAKAKLSAEEFEALERVIKKRNEAIAAKKK